MEHRPQLLRLKAFGKERDFLSPLVAFKVRGSVAATGGHDPELFLRNRFIEWGLQPAIDYNPSDVTIAALRKILGVKGGTVTNAKKKETDKKQAKSRAYDFVLPFKTPGVFRRVCVQSQFYAGDSGSVSHKNVDQTATSRRPPSAHSFRTQFLSNTLTVPVTSHP